MAGNLGIYFGPRLITIVETKGKRIITYAKIARSALGESELEEKVPGEIKIAALFNDELRKSRIEAKEAAISLSGKDLIVRTFELPVIPANELASAINFEAKKYIPFRVEDLVSDFQVEFDKSARKNLVLFVGIKKDSLERYLSLLQQLNIKISFIDYSAFSILRILKLAGLGKRGIVGLVSVDLEEEDETNFTVLENGFVVFSRDISLSSTPEELAKPEIATSGIFLEKLKTEIRVSFDYYQRKFPGKKIEKIFFISEEVYHPDLELFMKDLDLSAQFIDTAKFIGREQPFSLGLIKGFGCALSKVIKSNLKINLLLPRAKVFKKIKPERETFSLFALFANFKIDFRLFLAGLAIPIIVFGLSLWRIIPLRQQVNGVIASRPKTQLVPTDATTLQDLEKTDLDYQNKIKTVHELVTKQVYLTEPMEAISRTIPEDIWLTDLSFAKIEENKAGLTLRGFVYLEDKEKELGLINTFVTKLKESVSFNKYFKEVKLISIEQQQLGKVKVNSFTISCRE